MRRPEDLQAAMGTKFPPSPEQWDVITAPLEPAVVIAGAGSGKTTAMAARVVYLVLTEQVRPEQILGLTFTTKAAGELRTRIRDALRSAGVLRTGAGLDAGLGPGLDSESGDAEVLEPTVATYNSWAASLLLDHGLRIGHEPDTRVIANAARFQLGARAIDGYTGEVSLLSDHPETVIQNLLALDGAMSEHLVTPEHVREIDAETQRAFRRAYDVELAGKARKGHLEAPAKAINAMQRREELLGLVAAYRRLKAELGLMDFSDQVALAARLAGTQPDVGRQQREQFPVVLLDEYQDTSVAQADLLSLVFSGEPGAGRGHAVMAVGDPNQAIYGWRGASASNITRFPERFPAAVGTTATYPLTVNRRSDVRILETANLLAEPLLALDDSVHRLAPGTDEPGVVRTQVFERRDQELAWLVESVREAHHASPERTWADIGVLVRDNSHAEDVFDTLASASIPVEIVGLSGLVRLPEIAEVVATLHLLQDVTSNAQLLTLLTGARWAIGPRDLKLLSRRASFLAGREGRAAGAVPLDAQLLEIAEAIDPSEVPSLNDALDDPGAGSYSAQARERFALLAAELRRLRRHVEEPLLDLVRRVIDTTGVDVELASSVSPSAAARRDNLDLFVKAVAEFQAVDGAVSLSALLAYLTAEDEAGNGLEAATPTDADSVKLLTVHRAKGLEWDTVFLVGVCETRFPSNRSRTLWTSSPAVLPAPLRGDAPDLPQLRDFDKAGLDAYRAATRAHDALEERRLGYVAVTRAAHTLWLTGYLWSERATPFGPSDYQVLVRELLEKWDEPEPVWLDKPAKGAVNPYSGDDTSRPWPRAGGGEEARLRLAAAELVRSVDPHEADDLDLLDAARVAEWDTEMERLLAEARAGTADVVEVPAPSSLSATSLERLRDDPAGFARDLARPMPRPPSPQARFGTRFHAWVEARFGQQDLFDPDDLPGRGDVGIDDDDDLRALIERFEAGPFADRTPYAVEPAFALVLAGQVVRGRIDAVYEEPDGNYLVVDWKTSRSQSADPLQLAIYRLAWAELHGVDPARVRVAFHYVRSGETVVPAETELPGRGALERILAG